MRWQLEGPAGTVVPPTTLRNADAGDGPTDDALMLQAGSYTLSVDGMGDTVGEYRFRLLDLAQAQLLSRGQEVSGTLDSARETDLYRFEANAGQRFFLDRTLGDGASWRLLGPDGKQVLDARSLSTDIDTFTTLQTGTYTLLIEGDVTRPQAAVTPYAFTLHQVPDKRASLVLGQTREARFDVPGQSLAFDFELDARRQVLFDLLSNTSASSWWLTGPHGEVVEANAMRSVAGSDSRDFSGYTGWDPSRTDRQALDLDAGHYTLHFEATGDSKSSFQFRLLDLASTDPAYSRDIALNEVVDDTLANGAETRLYHFDAQAGDQLLFDILSATSYDTQ